MFKKSVEIKSLQRLSGADRKKLRRSVKEKFPHASDSDIDIIFPPKVEITAAKLQNRAIIYGVEGGHPMIFDVDGRGTEIFPTVFALWKVPKLLPAFMLKGGEVSRYVIGGADLMFPGISIPPEGLPSFTAGQPWSVIVPGNPSPIAVGTTAMSSAEALKAGLRGKALHITHYYRDSLWQMAEDRYVPNDGFMDDVVFEDPALLVSHETSDFPETVSKSSVSQTDTKDGELVDVTDVASDHDLNHASHGDDNAKIGISEEVLDVSCLKLEDVAVSHQPNVEERHPSSIEEIDDMLDRCLFQAFYTTVRDKDLPMPGSILWSGHVLSCRPAGITLDIKKSSHKKLSKWLQSKSSAGLISVKEDKHKKEVVLLSINRNHPDYTSFRPEKRQTGHVDHTEISMSSESHLTKQLEAVELYKSSTHTNSILTSLGIDTGNYYRASEAFEFVFQYVEKENLVKSTDKTMVVMDALLCDALFKGTIKKGSTYPTEIHKRDLGSVFLSRMQVYHRVTRGSESAIRKGALKPVQIMTERRQGNKKVTRVSGVESFLIDSEMLASELQKKFACSTSVAELPGKKAQNEVLIQGGVIDDLAKYLIEHYGISKSYIEVLDKTKK